MRIEKKAYISALTGGVLLLAGMHAQAQPQAFGLNFTKALHSIEAGRQIYGALVAKAEQAGWDKKFSLTINSMPGDVNQGVLQQAMAKAVGIEMIRDEMPIGEWMQKVRIQRNFDSAMGAIWADKACPWSMPTLMSAAGGFGACCSELSETRSMWSGPIS